MEGRGFKSHLGLRIFFQVYFTEQYKWKRRGEDVYVVFSNKYVLIHIFDPVLMLHCRPQKFLPTMQKRISKIIFKDKPNKKGKDPKQPQQQQQQQQVQGENLQAKLKRQQLLRQQQQIQVRTQQQEELYHITSDYQTLEGCDSKPVPEWNSLHHAC